CKGVASLPRYERYAFQEALADIAGLMFCIAAYPSLTSRNDVATTYVFETYFAELLRYAARAHDASPDSLAAWMQLSHFERDESLRISPEGLLDGSPTAVLESAAGALKLWAALLRSKDASRLQSVADTSKSTAAGTRRLLA